jgi:hypothetical protein
MARAASTLARSAMIAIAATTTVLLLAGCGSSSSTPASQATSERTLPATAPPSTAPHTRAEAPSVPGHPRGGTRTGPTGGTEAPSGSVRQAPGLSGAVAELERTGYKPSKRSEYHSNQTLRVLVGVRIASTDGHVQQAFFFVRDRYLGTDTSDPSAQIRVVAQDDTSVTLGYRLYRRGESLCCPGGGERKVRYALDNGRLGPLDPIPSSSPDAPLSRR